MCQLSIGSLAWPFHPHSHHHHLIQSLAYFMQMKSLWKDIAQHETFLISCKLTFTRSTSIRNGSGRSSFLSLMLCLRVPQIWPHSLGAMWLLLPLQTYLISLPNIRLWHDAGSWFWKFLLIAVTDADITYNSEYASVTTIHPVTIVCHPQQKDILVKSSTRGTSKKQHTCHRKYRRADLPESLEFIGTCYRRKCMSLECALDTHQSDMQTLMCWLENTGFENPAWASATSVVICGQLEYVFRSNMSWAHWSTLTVLGISSNGALLPADGSILVLIPTPCGTVMGITSW